MTSWPPVAPSPIHPAGTGPDADDGCPVAPAGALPSACRLDGGLPPPISVVAIPPPEIEVPDGQTSLAIVVVAGAAGPRTVASATTRAGAADERPALDSATRPLGWRADVAHPDTITATSTIANAI